jgi:hypothetical protein
MEQASADRGTDTASCPGDQSNFTGEAEIHLKDPVTVDSLGGVDVSSVPRAPASEG